MTLWKKWWSDKLEPAGVLVPILFLWVGFLVRFLQKYKIWAGMREWPQAVVTRAENSCSVTSKDFDDWDLGVSFPIIAFPRCSQSFSFSSAMHIVRMKTRTMVWLRTEAMQDCKVSNSGVETLLSLCPTIASLITWDVGASKMPPLVLLTFQYCDYFSALNCRQEASEPRACCVNTVLSRNGNKGLVCCSLDIWCPTLPRETLGVKDLA